MMELLNFLGDLFSQEHLSREYRENILLAKLKFGTDTSEQTV